VKCVGLSWTAGPAWRFAFCAPTVAKCSCCNAQMQGRAATDVSNACSDERTARSRLAIRSAFRCPRSDG
jgi:hypothetical protein